MHMRRLWNYYCSKWNETSHLRSGVRSRWWHHSSHHWKCGWCVSAMKNEVEQLFWLFALIKFVAFSAVRIHCRQLSNFLKLCFEFVNPSNAPWDQLISAPRHIIPLLLGRVTTNNILYRLLQKWVMSAFKYFIYIHIHIYAASLWQSKSRVKPTHLVSTCTILSRAK